MQLNCFSKECALGIESDSIYWTLKEFTVSSEGFAVGFRLKLPLDISMDRKYEYLVTVCPASSSPSSILNSQILFLCRHLWPEWDLQDKEESQHVEEEGAVGGQHCWQAGEG